MSVFDQRWSGSARPAQVIDETEVRRALAFFADGDAICQVFGLPSCRHANRLGSDLDGLVDAVGLLSNDDGIYQVLNPLSTTLSIQEGVVGGKRVHVGDVLYRRWLFLDVDPLKPVGSATDSATDEEHERTRQAAEEIQQHLAGLGWPAPVVVDSGNGWYLLWLIHLPADKDSQKLIRSWSRSMSVIVKDKAKIDRSVHDAPRLAKIPGTWARKGNNTSERPWRRCRLVFVPSELSLVTAEQIAAACNSAPSGDTGDTTTSKTKSKFALRAGSDNSRAYVVKALDNECARVSMSRSPTQGGEGRNNALNAAAFSLGTLIGGGYLERGEVERRLVEAAGSCGLDRDDNCGERGIDKTIRSGIDAGIQKPRVLTVDAASAGDDNSPSEDDAPELCFRADDNVLACGSLGELLSENEQKSGRVSREEFCMYTLPRLMATMFPEPKWVVPGILSEGLNVLAGKPKLGKSMMAFNLALTIAGGGMALKTIATAPGNVLYLSLEDKERRLQTRARKMLRSLDVVTSERLWMVTRWPRLDRGGVRFLDLWYENVPTPTLVIVDVWQKFRPALRHGGSLYEQDYEHLEVLKEYVDQRHCNALVLMHCRKSASEDVLEEVSGTAGQTGAADGIIVLTRSRGTNEAKIFVTGRDVQETELSLQFDSENLVWSSLGPSSLHLEGQLQQRVLDYLKRHGTAFACDIARALETSGNTVRNALARLHDKYLIRKEGRAWSYVQDPDQCQADEEAL